MSTKVLSLHGPPVKWFVKVSPNSFCICLFTAKDSVATNNNVTHRPYMYFNQLSSQDSAGLMKIRLTRAHYFILPNILLEFAWEINSLFISTGNFINIPQTKLYNTWRPTIRPSFSVYQQTWFELANTQQHWFAFLTFLWEQILLVHYTWVPL